MALQWINGVRCSLQKEGKGKVFKSHFFRNPKRQRGILDIFSLRRSRVGLGFAGENDDSATSKAKCEASFSSNSESLYRIGLTS
ncbi:hypothetical protein Rcae01_04022 [Novipirellula caenicola]|uniref:Uncharacterized protein n=1 Tax=Novipirellula caenicola TaxID=1536901 RepID=A0ABP9VVC2_9BACT